MFVYTVFCTVLLSPWFSFSFYRLEVIIELKWLDYEFIFIYIFFFASYFYIRS